MYFKKLYRQSRFWFVIVVLFAAGQLFINYKHGVEFSPFYHYDMFSLLFTAKPNYKATEVSINGVPLQTKNFTPNGWDNIVLPIIQYQNSQNWNSLIYNTVIKRLLHFNDSSLYTNQLSHQQFDAWYRQRIIHLLRLPQDANIQYQIVSYHQQHNALYR